MMDKKTDSIIIFNRKKQNRYWLCHNNTTFESVFLYFKLCFKIHIFHFWRISKLHFYTFSAAEWESCSENEDDDSDGEWVDVHHSSDEEEETEKPQMTSEEAEKRAADILSSRILTQEEFEAIRREQQRRQVTFWGRWFQAFEWSSKIVSKSLAKMFIVSDCDTHSTNNLDLKADTEIWGKTELVFGKFVQKLCRKI